MSRSQIKMGWEILRYMVEERGYSSEGVWDMFNEKVVAEMKHDIYLKVMGIDPEEYYRSIN